MKRHSITPFIAFILLFFSSLPYDANAQFFKKLGDAAKKELKKMVETPTKTKKSDNNKDHAQQSDNKSQASVTDKPVEIPTISIFTPTYKSITITPNTKFVNTPTYSNVSDMHDGVWSVEKDYRTAFFLADGRKLFDYDWVTNATYRDPKFSDGAIIMYKHNETYKKPMYILYKDGNVKELPAKYVGATNFVDGVALVGVKIGAIDYEYHFIDTNGNRVYSGITSLPQRFNRENHTLAPIREGLRAYFDYKARAWGYIDTKGNIVIAPRFKEVRSFSDGIALVKENDDVYFIDKTGKKAFTPKWNTFDTYFSAISDCVNNRIYVASSDEYYDKTGKLISKVHAGSQFYGEYAFCKMDDDEGSSRFFVVDTDFNKIRLAPDIDVSWSDDPCPMFSEAGVVSDNGMVLLPDGRVVIGLYNRINGELQHCYIDQFTESYLAKAKIRHNGSWFHGFINPNGEYTIIFDWDKELTKITEDEKNPTPEPIIPPEDSLPEIPIPPYPIPIEPIDDTPIGPRIVTNKFYTVTVSASPAEGGSVTGGGKYRYGNNARLGATANKGWKFIGWDCNTEGYYYNGSSEISINGNDLSFTARFLKKDSVEKVDTKAIVSSSHSISDGSSSLDFTVYMELSKDNDIATPYGNATGYLTLLMDASKYESFPFNYATTGFCGTPASSGTGNVKYKFFFSPMKIVGISTEGTKDNQKQYLILEGGQFMVGGLSTSVDDPLMMLYMNFFMSSNGGIFASISDGRYRIPISNFNPETGECTLGSLQRFHTEHGWLPSDSKKFSTKRKSIFGGSQAPFNIPPFVFSGAVLKPSAKQKVEWTPPADWYSTENLYTEATQRLINMMNSFVSDYETFWNE